MIHTISNDNKLSMKLTSSNVSINPFSTCSYPIILVTWRWNWIYCFLMVWYASSGVLNHRIVFNKYYLLPPFRILCSQQDWSVPSRLLPMPSDKQQRVFLDLHLVRAHNFEFKYFKTFLNLLVIFIELIPSAFKRVLKKITANAILILIFSKYKCGFLFRTKWKKNASRGKPWHELKLTGFDWNFI